MINPQKENFQKLICCRVIEDQSRKVELFKVTLLFGVIPSDGILYCDSYSLHLHVFIYTSGPNLDLLSENNRMLPPFVKIKQNLYFDATHLKKGLNRKW